MACREAISRLLAASAQESLSYVYHCRQTQPRAAKRKIETLDDSDDDEDIYEGIKRLYNEEDVPVVPMVSCVN